MILFFTTQDLVKISGRSMQPRIKNGDYALVNRLAYWFVTPKRGDIVYYQLPTFGGSESAIGRIVGLPGETVGFLDGKVTINGKMLAEDYLADDTETDANKVKGNEIVLGLNEYVILGDNRGLSRDSRTEGPISRKAIGGKFWLVDLSL